MRYLRGVMGAAVGWLVGSSSAWAVTPGQVDTFEGGSLLGWQNGGVTNPNPATNTSTGGPAGANDNYMLVRANGGGAGGKLVVFNTDQWAGDYIDADIDAVQM